MFWRRERTSKLSISVTSVPLPSRAKGHNLTSPMTLVPSLIKKRGRIQDEILYAVPEECKSYKGLELDGFHIRVWYYLLVVLFRQAASLLDMSCTNPDHPSRPVFQGWGSVISHPCAITRRLRKVCLFQYTLHTIALFALFGHGDTFALHDVPLKFGIKCCPFFGGSRTTTSLGVTICFVSSHIISSALLEHVIVDSQPLILNTFEYNRTVSSEGTSHYRPSTSSRSFRLFPELPPVLCPCLFLCRLRGSASSTIYQSLPPVRWACSNLRQPSQILSPLRVLPLPGLIRLLQ